MVGNIAVAIVARGCRLETHLGLLVARKLPLLLCLLTAPFLPQDVGLLEYQHHPRDYTSHLSPGSIIQPQRRRPSLLSEFQPGSER